MRQFLKTLATAVISAGLLLAPSLEPLFAQSVPTSFGGNLLTNPWMEIDQLMEGASISITATAAGTFTYGGGGSAAAFTLGTTDGWGSTDATSASSLTMAAQTAALNLGGGGSKSELLYTVGTGSATHADGTLITIEQRIEPFRLAPLQYGNANAQGSYLSFCAKASLAGTYGFYIAGGTAARTSDVTAGTSGSAYFHAFSLAAAQAQCFQFFIPGDTGGTWLTTTNTVDATHGATLGFVLGINGVTTKTYGVPTATSADGVWQNLTNSGAAAQVIGNNTTYAAMDKTTGATFELTAVKWALDANPLVHNPEIELIQAQRYFTKTTTAGVGGVAGVAPRQNSPSNYTGTLCGIGQAASAGAVSSPMWTFPTQMRAAPTIVTYNPKTGAATFSNFSQADGALAVSVDPASVASLVGVMIKCTGTPTAAGDVICIRASADARL